MAAAAAASAVLASPLPEDNQAAVATTAAPNALPPAVPPLVVFSGIAGSGCSTLVGSLLIATKSISDAEVLAARKAAESVGAASSALSFITVKLKEERERRVRLKTAQFLMNSSISGLQFQVTAPPPLDRNQGAFLRAAGLCGGGHNAGIRNNATGALVVYVISADSPELLGDRQLRNNKHLVAFFALGLARVIFVVNKMDIIPEDNRAQCFLDIEESLKKAAKRIGFKDTRVHVVPASALQHMNVAAGRNNNNNEFSPFHSGPPLLQLMEQVFMEHDAALHTQERHQMLQQLPPRFLVDKVYSVGGVGSVVGGRMLQGTLHVGDRVLVSSALERRVILNSIEFFHQPRGVALPGMMLGLVIEEELSNVNNPSSTPPCKQRRRPLILATPGSVIGCPFRDPPLPVVSFEAQLIVINSSNGIFERGTIRNNNRHDKRTGFQPTAHSHSAQARLKFFHIKQQLDKRTGRAVEDNPARVRQGEACIVEIRPVQPLVVEAFKDGGILGRMVCRDSRQIVSVAAVMAVQPVDSRKWWARRVALLIRFQSKNRFAEAFSVWNIMTTTALFLA